MILSSRIFRKSYAWRGSCISRFNRPLHCNVSRCFSSHGEEWKKAKSSVEEQSKKSQKLALQATSVGAGVNFALFLSKGVTGYLVNSTALLADAFGSLGDLCTDAIVYYSVEQARKEASPDRPWGRGKMEPIGAFVVSCVLGATGVGIGYTAIGKVWQTLASSPDFVTMIPAKLATVLGVSTTLDAIAPVVAAADEFVYGALAVSACSMYIGIALIYYTVHLDANDSNVGNSANSAAVVANAWQHRSDVMVSAAVFLGLSGSHLGYPILDPAVAVIVAGIITKQAYHMGTKSLRDLSDAPASLQETERLKATVASIKGIEFVKDLKARQSGPFLFVECSIAIAGQLSASTAHRLAELVKRRLMTVHADRVSNVVVHVVPLGSAGLGEKTGENNRSHIYIRKEVIRILLQDSELHGDENRPKLRVKSEPVGSSVESTISKSPTDSDSDSESDSDNESTKSKPDKCKTVEVTTSSDMSVSLEESERLLLRNITSVEEVQVYYRDDGRVSLKVDVAMDPSITIRDAHKIAVTAAKHIHRQIEGVADVDVDLELDEGGWGPDCSATSGSWGTHVRGKVKREELEFK